jgi:curved DNA-binding protein CbpA
MTTPTPDPYRILGVTAVASDDDLDHAFRGLVRRHHPDTRSSSESAADADQRLQEILTAYAMLRDPVRRAAYDRTRAGPASVARMPAHPPRLSFPAQPSPPVRIRPPICAGPVHWTPPPRRAG